MTRYGKEAATRTALDGRTPTEVDYIYLAGLFDGEGSFDVMNHATPRLKISMTDGPTIQWCKDTFGGPVYEEKPSGSQRKMAWKWTVVPRSDVEAVVRGMRPHLKLKADRADAVLAVLDLYANATASSYKNTYWLNERDELLHLVRARAWDQRMYEGTLGSSKTH